VNVAIQAHALHIGVGDAGWQYLASLNCGSSTVPASAVERAAWPRAAVRGARWRTLCCSIAVQPSPAPTDRATCVSASSSLGLVSEATCKCIKNGKNAPCDFCFVLAFAQLSCQFHICVSPRRGAGHVASAKCRGGWMRGTHGAPIKRGRRPRPSACNHSHAVCSIRPVPTTRK
jgi:hypothetical protein